MSDFDYSYDISACDDNDTICDDYDDYDDYDDCDNTDASDNSDMPEIFTDIEILNSEGSELSDTSYDFEPWEFDSVEYEFGVSEYSDTPEDYSDTDLEETKDIIQKENTDTQADHTDISSVTDTNNNIDSAELTDKNTDKATSVDTGSASETSNDIRDEEDITVSEEITEASEKIDDKTDWTRTSSRPEEEAILREMEENGEIEVIEKNPDLPDPEHASTHLPSKKTGIFTGEKGNSEFIPSDEKALAKMKEYGRESVNYSSNNPDFSPFTVHESPWGKINGQVEIGHMTTNRRNGVWEYGERPDGTSHDPAYDIGNFAQADNAIAEQLRSSFPDIKGEDIEAFRIKNHLTLHECADGITMQLIPEEIHNACRHSGGVSEMKYRMAWGDITRKE